MPILGKQIGKELLEALGLPKLTIGFTLRCYAEDVVTVQCEYFPEGSFVSALADYELQRKEEPAKFNFDKWYQERNELAHRKFMGCDIELSRIDCSMNMRGSR